MEGFLYEKDDQGIVTVTMDMEGKVNTYGGSFIADLKETLDKLEKEDVKGVILTSAKETFCAGADLKSMGPRKGESAEEAVFNSIESIKALFRRLEKLGKPVVAAINGTALGGGYELSLACHHRIALNNPKSKIGLPEAGLGLLPGAGGTVKMTYLFGPEMAFQNILQSKQFKPEVAHKQGLVHEIAETPEEMIAKAKKWIEENTSPKQPWDSKGYKMPGGDQRQFMVMAPVMMFQKTKGVYPAHTEILKVIVQTLKVDFDTAMRIETRGFAKIVKTPEARNMISTFFLELTKLKAGGSRPQEYPKNAIKKLGVLGGGMMGSGIAYVAALSGIDVVIKEVNQEKADAAKEFSAKKEEAYQRITATDSYDDLQDCDLIIEAVFEDPKLKAEVTKEAEKKLASTGFFGSNTSTLPITMLAKASEKPENFIGLHFFSPVEKMPLLEIIVGEKTSDETLAKAFDFALQIRKTPIVVNDSPGFFTSRVIGTYIREAVEMLLEGVHPARIDRVAKLSGFPVGPLALWDEVSQKLSLSIAKSNNQTEGAMYQILDELVNTHNRGGKAYGGGVYEYPKGGRKHIWPKIIELYHKPDYEISNEEIKKRFLYIQSLETMKCIEEGVIRHVRDANIGSIFGIGYPPPTGGVLQHVNTMGTKQFLSDVQELEKKYGKRFSPPKILVEKAEKGDGFY